MRIRYVEPHALPALDRGRRVGDQPMVERAAEPVVLHFAMAARDLRRHRRLVEDPRKIEALRLPVLDAAALVEQIGAADQIVEAPDPELRHQLAHFLGDEEEIVDDVLGLLR